jgi:hypothetical protein
MSVRITQQRTDTLDYQPLSDKFAGDIITLGKSGGYVASRPYTSEVFLCRPMTSTYRGWFGREKVRTRWAEVIKVWWGGNWAYVDCFDVSHDSWALGMANKMKEKYPWVDITLSRKGYVL